MLRRVRAIISTTVALIFLTAPSLAQDWPSRSVRIVSPFAAGGASDVLGNVIAKNLSKRFNHRFLLENQPGRGGQLGSVAVARAAPDGYTFLLPSLASHVFSPLCDGGRFVRGGRGTPVAAVSAATTSACTRCNSDMTSFSRPSMVFSRSPRSISSLRLGRFMVARYRSMKSPKAFLAPADAPVI